MSGQSPLALLAGAAIERAPNVLLLTVLEDAGRLVAGGSNEAFSRVSGLPMETLHGAALGTVLAAEGIETQDNLRDLLASGGSGRVQMSLAKAGIVFDADVLPATAPDGRPCLVLLGRDATAQARAAEQQRAVQALLATAFYSVPVAVAVVAQDGRFQMTNPALDRLIGFGTGEVVGRPTLEFVAPASREAVMQARDRQLADGATYTLPIQAVRKDGSPFAAEMTSVRVRGTVQKTRILILRSNMEADQPPAPMLVAGKVRLVGLAEVKAELGDRWPGLARRALATAEHVIRKRIAAADTFAPTEDEGFLICFATASEEEASFRASTISREIRQRLIGGGEPPAVAHVTSVARAVPPPPPNGADHSAAALETHLSAHLDARMDTVQAEARKVIAAALRDARCEADPVYGRAGRAQVAALVRFPRGAGMRLHAAAAALPAKDAAELDLDGFLLRLADVHARTDALHGGATPILVNVGFDPFTSMARTDRYVGACRALSPKVQQRLILLLSNFPSDLARVRVEDCIHRLRPFCRAVGFEVDDLEVPPVEQAASGGTIVAIPANAPALLTPVRAGQFTGFAAALSAKRCKLLVRDVPSWAEAERLRGLGVDLVTVEEPPEA